MTSSVLDVRPALAVPTIHHLPPDVHSLAAAEEAIEWGECYGLSLDPDQRATLTAALAERKDGSWAAAEVADFKGRQAGKNDTLKVRQGAGIDLFGEQLIIHTAHEYPTANEDFIRLAAVYENYDELRKTVARIRYANGEQGIEFLSGARIKYRARTHGAGRGFADVDLVVYDEAQDLMPEHLAASMPTLLVNPNFQAWYSGSGGKAGSLIAWNLRRRALSGAGGRLGYTENTAQSVTLENGRLSLGMPDDLLSDETLSTHPGYANGRVGVETFETMHKALGPELFGREILCIWEPPADNTDAGPIPMDLWQKLADPKSTPVEASVRLSLDAPPELTTAAFAIAGRRKDGLTHVQSRYFVGPPEMGKLVLLAKQITDHHSTPLILPPNSPAKAWKSKLVEAGIELDELTHAEYAEACGAMRSEVTGGSLRHRGSPELTSAIGGLGVRRSGDIDTWSRRSSRANIAPFVAATCALLRVPDTEPAFDGEWFTDLDDFDDMED